MDTKFQIRLESLSMNAHGSIHSGAHFCLLCLESQEQKPAKGVVLMLSKSLAAKLCLKGEPFVLILSQSHDCDAAVASPTAQLVWVSLAHESCLRVCCLTVIVPLLNIPPTLIALHCRGSISLTALSVMSQKTPAIRSDLSESNE